MQVKGLGLGGLMAIVALVGCGSSNGSGGTGGSTGTGGGSGGGNGGTMGSGGSFTTSVTSGTKLTALTAGQAAQLCSDVRSFVDNTFSPALCRATTALSGSEAAYIDLLQNPTASTAELRAACASAAAVDAGTSCSATSRTPALRPATSRRFRRPAGRPWATTRSASTTRASPSFSCTPPFRAAAR